MNWHFLLFRNPNYVIGIEKEGIVIGCQEYAVVNQARVDSCVPLQYTYFSCYVVFLLTSLSQLIIDASLIIAKLINLTVKKYFASYSIKYSAY
jgi:hypothetical protein